MNESNKLSLKDVLLSENEEDELAIQEMKKIRKSSFKEKWSILILSSFLLFGDYYAYDVPFALKEQLRQEYSQQYDSNQFEYLFNLTYTCYQVPNIFLPFINGYISDKVRFTQIKKKKNAF
jgi:hypothetical protein